MDKFIKYRALQPLGWLAVDLVYAIRAVLVRAEKWNSRR